MKKALFLAMALMAATIQLSGKITLPSIISDNMVLQQKSSVKLWGWAEPGEELSLAELLPRFSLAALPASPAVMDG